MALPFLSVTNADVFESTRFMAQKFGHAHPCSALILLKLKVLIDVINIRLSRKVLKDKLPVELWQDVARAVVRSPLSVPLIKKTSLELVQTEGWLIG